MLRAEVVEDGDVEVGRLLSTIDTADAERLVRVWHGAISSGEEVETHFRIQVPGGGTRWLQARGRSEKDANGRLVSVQGVLRDETEQQRARAENEELRRDLAHAGRVSVLGTLSSSLAHELSQPLGAILLNAEAAVRRPTNSPDADGCRAMSAR